jgi:hypothetical protein
VVLLDANLPDLPGSASWPGSANPASGIIILAFGTIRNAVGDKAGASAYLEKPVDNEELLLDIARILEVRDLRHEVEALRSELTSRYRFSNIVGTSARMNSVFQLMEKISRVEGTVLITGESGTGKELVARAVHFAGPRKDGPFVVVNCGAVPRDLFESEFFGHVKGAFTDARSDKTGKFEQANGGRSPRQGQRAPEPVKPRRPSAAGIAGSAGPDGAHRRPRDRGHEQGPRRPRSRGFPRGPLFPPGCPVDRPTAVARAGRGHPPRRPFVRSAGELEKSVLGLLPGRSTGWPGMPGRATFVTRERYL